MSAALSNQAAARQLLNFFYDSMDTLWVWAGTQQENVRNKDILPLPDGTQFRQ